MSSGSPFVADFWATWCGPCKLISPHFEKLEAKYPQIKFVKVDVDEQAVSALAHHDVSKDSG
jgi:thioredoxin 1